MSPFSLPKPSQTQLPLFILDFDGTITQSDTILPLLHAAAAVTHHPQPHHHSPPPATADQNLSHVLNSYSADWEHFHASPPDGLKVTDFTSVRDLVRYQRALKGIEGASFERVGASGLLKGTSREDWFALAKGAVDGGDVSVREGFRGFVDELEGREGRWGIVSVNFCEDWIRSVLATAIGKDKSERVAIHANQPGEDGMLRGYGGREVFCTSDGKLEALKSMIEMLRGGSGSGIGSGDKVVYVGDSSTDIECLLYDDVDGIVMVKEDGGNKLLDMLESIGESDIEERFKYLKTVRSIRNYDHEWKERNGKRMWFARNFEDILDSQLFGKS